MTTQQSLTKASEPRDWPEDFGDENGNYQCICLFCKNTFMGYKRRLVCKVCHEAGKNSLTDVILDWMMKSPARIRQAMAYDDIARLRKAIEESQALSPVSGREEERARLWLKHWPNVLADNEETVQSLAAEFRKATLGREKE